MREFGFAGRSGEIYAFGLLESVAQWRRRAGLYAFMRLDLFGAVKLLYVGESVCIQSRLLGHERWRDAVRKGANQIAVREALHPEVRLATERDLIKQHHPPLNRVHRLRLADVAPPVLTAEQAFYAYWERAS